MQDDGSDNACRDGKDSAPSPVRENPKGNYHQGSQYREFDDDPGHGPPFPTRLTAGHQTIRMPWGSTGEGDRPVLSVTQL
jgi:hypothetical protein